MSFVEVEFIERFNTSPGGAKKGETAISPFSVTCEKQWF